ncbi:hypothetical protein D3C85_1026380 [compost metagenome]
MVKQQAFIMSFENVFTHQTNILIFAHHPEAEPRGILLIKPNINTLWLIYIFKVLDIRYKEMDIYKLAKTFEKSDKNDYLRK